MPIRRQPSHREVANQPPYLLSMSPEGPDQEPGILAAQKSARGLAPPGSEGLRIGFRSGSEGPGSEPLWRPCGAQREPRS